MTAARLPQFQSRNSRALAFCAITLKLLVKTNSALGALIGVLPVELQSRSRAQKQPDLPARRQMIEYGPRSRAQAATVTTNRADRIVGNHATGDDNDGA